MKPILWSDILHQNAMCEHPHVASQPIFIWLNNGLNFVAHEQRFNYQYFTLLHHFTAIRGT